MLGTKISILYKPSTTFDFSITSDTWGTYVGAIAAVFPTIAYGIGIVSNYMPQGIPTSSYLEYVNTSESSELLLRVVFVWDVPPASPESDNFSVFLEAVETGTSDATTVATLDDFADGGIMEYVKATVNLWSNEETPPGPV